MKVILQERIVNLGGIGELVKVKGGYARNYLLPFGKALAATKENIAVIASKRKELEAIEAKKKELAENKSKLLSELGTLKIAVKTRDDTRLFGSVGATELLALIAEAGHEVARNDIKIVDGVIRELGVYEFHVHCYADTHAKLKVEVVSDATK